MSITGIYNADGEPIGIDYHYDDYDSPYDDYHDPGPGADDIGPHEGCCQRGDWSGARHQPASAYIYRPLVFRGNLLRGEVRTAFDPCDTEDYLYECDYCGRIGTRAELNGSPYPSQEV